MILCGRDCMSHRASIYSSCEVVLILSDLEEFFSILMSDFREALWKNNADLKEALLKYVGQGLQR